jgi:TM2 domain-containing membrane protein YozV
MIAPRMAAYANTAAMDAAPPALLADMRIMMMFEADKKEACVAYVLWFCLGWVGAHNFYLGRTGVAVVQLLLTLSIVGIGITFFWHLIDAIFIPGWVRRENNKLLAGMLVPSPYA